MSNIEINDYKKNPTIAGFTYLLIHLKTEKNETYRKYIMKTITKGFKDLPIEFDYFPMIIDIFINVLISCIRKRHISIFEDLYEVNTILCERIKLKHKLQIIYLELLQKLIDQYPSEITRKDLEETTPIQIINTLKLKPLFN